MNEPIISFKRLILLVPLSLGLIGCSNSKDPGETLLSQNVERPRPKSSQGTGGGNPRREGQNSLSVAPTGSGSSASSVEVPIPLSKDPDDPKPVEPEDEDMKTPPEKDPPIPKTAKPLKEGLPLYIDTREDGSKVVHVLAEVCLRRGPLEVLLTRQNRKEHEAILRVDLDGRLIHTALLAVGAEVGSPTQFQPKYKPATGTEIKVYLTYHDKGELKTVPAQSWIYDAKNKKEMAINWVFAGSRFLKDPDNPNDPPYYLANNGEFISVANFPDSMLDIPVESSKDNDHRFFEANTKKIPPLMTKVLVTFEPVLKKK